MSLKQPPALRAGMLCIVFLLSSSQVSSFQNFSLLIVLFIYIMSRPKGSRNCSKAIPAAAELTPTPEVTESHDLLENNTNSAKVSISLNNINDQEPVCLWESFKTRKRTGKNIVAKKAVEKISEKATEKAIGKAFEKATKKTKEKATKKVTEKTTKKATEKPTKQPTEKPIKQLTEKAIKKAEAKKKNGL